MRKTNYHYDFICQMAENCLAWGEITHLERHRKLENIQSVLHSVFETGYLSKEVEQAIDAYDKEIVCKQQ